MHRPDETVRPVVQLVAARAASAPASLALASRDLTLTYAELDARAARVARQLDALGVGRGAVVGMCVERSVAWAVGALGILRANAAYLPIDPAQPPSRVAMMLRDAAVTVLLASPGTADGCAQHGCTVLVIDAQPSHAAATGATPAITATAGDLAYVIYTSGSTGRPKGVEITHGALANLVTWHQRVFGITPDDRSTQLSSPGFDAAGWEIWPYLAAGASVHLPDEATRVAPELLRDWLVTERISVSFAVTPIAERLLELPWPPGTALRLLLTGGDQLTRRPRAGLPFLLVNNYGPTETTVVATSGLVPPESGQTSPPTIGRPIANVEVHVLDDRLRPVPAGIPGELYVGGAGVARGYVNDVNATARSFIPNPFGRGRLYRTGDLVRVEPDGQLAFLGRVDDQIKIRGHRIEPGEICRAINTEPTVQESVVVARADGAAKTLVAYVVPRPGKTLTSSALVGHLRSRLPDSMIPSAFVQLDRLPLNASGKIDRAALPAPTDRNTIHDAGGLRSPVEARVACILAALLGLPDVALDENFFLLGGHSLLGAQVIARLRDAFGVDVSLRRLFDAPTVAGLAAEVERLIEAEVSALSDADVRRLLEEGPADRTQPQ